MSTLREYINGGYTGRIYHDVIGCGRGVDLDLVALATILGPDYDMFTNMPRLLARYRCERCRGNRKPCKGGMVMHIHPARPPHSGLPLGPVHGPRLVKKQGHTSAT